MLMTFPPLREKKAMRSRDDQAGPKLQYAGSETGVIPPLARSSTYTTFWPLRSELKHSRLPSALGATRPWSYLAPLCGRAHTHPRRGCEQRCDNRRGEKVPSVHACLL